MATIYIIRHGQASFGEENYDQLSPTGYLQATQLGKHLSKLSINIQEVVTGGMQRHLQTAENSLSELLYKGPKTLDHQWNEYDHTSILAGYKPEYSDIEAIKRDIIYLPEPMKAFQGIFEEAIHRWASGQFPEEYPESWEEMVNRTVQGFEKIRNRIQPGQAILVYTSAGTISALLSSLMNLSLKDTFRLQWNMPNCAVTTIHIHDNTPEVSSVSEINFFEEHANLLTYR